MSWRSGGLDKTIHDFLHARLVERDFELVEVDRHHPAIAELLVKYPVARLDLAALGRRWFGGVAAGPDLARIEGAPRQAAAHALRNRPFRILFRNTAPTRA